MSSAEILIDGQAAEVGDLSHFVLSNYGAFTSMQVEDGGVRGLDLHLARLEAEAVELFGVAVPEALLRQRMRQALDGRPGRFSLRINLFSEAISLRSPDAIVQPRVLTTLSPPASALTKPLRLKTQIYAREVPHLKHWALPAHGVWRRRPVSTTPCLLMRAGGYPKAASGTSASFGATLWSGQRRLCWWERGRDCSNAAPQRPAGAARHVRST